jgi:peptide/nickel transport system permease protein
LRQYALRRLIYLPLIALAVSAITFFVLRLPFALDPVAEHSTQATTVEQSAAIKHEFGLDKPMAEQYVTWMKNIVTGHLGVTYNGRQSVAAQIKQRVPVTAEILILSVLFGTFFGVTFGIISAVKQDTMTDYICRVFAVFGQSIPEFFLLILLIVLPSIWWKYSAPVGSHSLLGDPKENLRLFIPPTLVLGIGGAAGLMRITRSTLLEVFRQDYIRTARAKGLRRSSVVLTHAMRNSLIPIVTIVGGQIAALFFGTVILEQIFSIQGIGQFFFNSVLTADLPVVEFLVLYTSLIVILLNLAVDLSYALIDPRVKYT